MERNFKLLISAEEEFALCFIWGLFALRKVKPTLKPLLKGHPHNSVFIFNIQTLNFCCIYARLLKIRTADLVSFPLLVLFFWSHSQNHPAAL